MNLQTAAPVEIDTVLADIWARRGAALERMDRVIDSLHRTAGDRKDHYGRSTYWRMSLADAEAKAREVAAAPTTTSWDRRSATSTLADLDETRATLAALKDEEAPYAAEYARRPWNRFYHLTSSANGHIHSSTDCGSCNNGHYRSTFAWLLDWADKSEAEALAALREQAHTMCNRCFPNAPTGWDKPVEKAWDPAYCKGQGEYARNPNLLRMSKTGTCPTCGHTVSVSSTGKVLKHKTPEAK